MMEGYLDIFGCAEKWRKASGLTRGVRPEGRPAQGGSALGGMMRLDDRISAIFNELELRKYNEQQADWFYRNFNEALVRAKKLEDLANAVSVATKELGMENPGWRET